MIAARAAPGSIATTPGNARCTATRSVARRATRDARVITAVLLPRSEPSARRERRSPPRVSLLSGCATSDYAPARFRIPPSKLRARESRRGDSLDWLNLRQIVAPAGLRGRRPIRSVASAQLSFGQSSPRHLSRVAVQQGNRHVMQKTTTLRARGRVAMKDTHRLRLF